MTELAASTTASTSEFARGWRVLTASFVGVGVSLVSLTYYSAGIWVIPWQEEFGWTRAQIGAAQLISTLTLVASAPLAGKLIDGLGLRPVATTSLILFAAGLFAVSRMSGDLEVFYALVAAYTLVGVAATPLAFTRAVNAWFDRHRGLALGICLTSTGVAGVLLPRFLTPYVAEQGWRAGYIVLVVIVLAAVPIVWAWIRDHPPEVERATADGKPILVGLSFADAARSGVFWRLAAVFLLIAIAVCGLIPNFIPLLQDAGLSAAAAGGYGAVVGASVMGGRLITGFLIDRVFAAYVTTVVFLLVAAGCLALGLGGVAFALPAAIALGFAIGAEVDLIGYFTARYFGLRSYGVIYGVQYSAFSIGCGVSPIIAGHIWDRTGGYELALQGAAVLLAAAAALSLTLPRFTDHPSPTAAPEEAG